MQQDDEVEIIQPQRAEAVVGKQSVLVHIAWARIDIVRPGIVWSETTLPMKELQGELLPPIDLRGERDVQLTLEDGRTFIVTFYSPRFFAAFNVDENVAKRKG
jgi:hypothetical protein